MNIRSLRAVMLGLVLGGLVVGAALPAQAASLSWDDAVGDATDAGVGAAVLPNDAAYDIAKVSLSNDGGQLNWSVAIPGLADGTPALSTGYNFRLAFTHDGGTYWFKVSEDVSGAQAFALSATATGSAALPCDKCVGKIDREAKAVVVAAPLASLDKALKAAEAAPATGSEWSVIYVIAQRPISVPGAGGVTLTADQADAPEGAILAF